MAITRGALRIRDRKTTRSTRHMQDKTSMPKTSPLTQDRANKRMAITCSALRSRDDRTRSTRHLKNKTSMPKTSPRSKDRANKGMAITRSALRIRDRKKTGPPRQHVKQGKTRLSNTSPLAQDRVNRDISITCSALRSRDDRTRSTRHLKNKTSMPKTSPLSKDRASKGIPITRGALRIREHKKTGPPTQHVIQDKSSMCKASPLAQDRVNRDISITGGALNTKGHKRRRSTRQRVLHVQDKASMSKALHLSTDKASKNIAIARSARRTRAVRPPSSPSKVSPLSKDRAGKDIAIERSARRTRGVRLLSSPSPSNMPATKLARMRPSSSPSPSHMPATKLARMRPPSSPSPSNMTATKVGDIFVKSIIDKNRCRITGSAIMSDNRLILVDDSNNKVKLINTNTSQLMFTLNVYARPWDVSAISEHQAVVTFPDCSKIMVVKVTDTIVKEREITVSGMCNGVAYSRDRLLLAKNSNLLLEILDLYGTVIMTVDYDTDGNKLFCSPLYVCISEDGETVYVSDWARHTVTSLTLDGAVKAVYKDEELKYPGKVCTDHHGNVYICGVWNSNVHMLTADCRKVKVILTQEDGLDSNVWSVSHCHDTNRLFIGMESNTIQSYQLA